MTFVTHLTLAGGMLLATALSSFALQAPRLYTVEKYTYQGQNCPPVAGCMDISFEYPVIHQGTPAARAKIAKGIQDMMGLSKIGFKEHSRKWSQDYREYQRDLKATMAWTYETKVKVQHLTSRWVSLEVNHYEFTGGAHGNYWTRYLNYDLKTGEPITLDQLFDGNYHGKLKTLAEKAFRQKREIKDGESFSDAGFSFKANQFWLPDFFLLEPQNVKFLFDVYDVGPYAAGQTEFDVFFYQMKDHISNQNPYIKKPH